MTFTELLPMVDCLSPAEKLKLIRILAEDLDSEDDISPLVPGQEYQLFTPYGCDGAADALLDALKTTDE